VSDAAGPLSAALLTGAGAPPGAPAAAPGQGALPGAGALSRTGLQPVVLPRTGAPPRPRLLSLADRLLPSGLPSPAHTPPPSPTPTQARAATSLLSPTGLLSHGGDGPPVTLPRDPAREAAKRELAKRMYHDHEPSLLLRALNRVWDWVEHLFAAASGVTPGGGLGLFVIVLALLALTALLWWRLGTPRRTPTTTAAPLFDHRPRTAAEHRAAAEAHASQGHWTQAVQERMRALVLALEERALLDRLPGRTADEAAAQAAAVLPAHEDRLRAAARDFDHVTYGGRSGDPQAYHRLSALDDDLARARPVVTASGAPATDRP
jgi:hypothetical protein